MTPSNATLLCPLCSCTENTVVAALTGVELRKLWKNLLKKDLSPEAWGIISPEKSVGLHKCNQCGFKFFDPHMAGNGAFYRELEHANYYSPSRPEFARTRAFARPRRIRRVLDIGCGAGGFLDLMKEDGCETHGLELNPSAATQASARGHTIHPKLLEDLDNAVGTFDLITAFQVLEHVADPVDFLRQACRFLRSGGFISVAMPSSSGINALCPWDPHQWPPHHVSYWRSADLRRLGSAVGLKCLEVEEDVLLGRDLEFVWRLHNRLADVVDKPRWFGGSLMASCVSRAYRFLGARHFFRRGGRSVAAFYQSADPE